jgi:hypothetical protein
MHSSNPVSKMSQRKQYDTEAQRDERRRPDAKRLDRERSEARRSKRDWE